MLNRIGNTLLFIFIIQQVSVGAAGVYDLGISYFFIGSRLALLGLGHLLIRDVAADISQIDKYVSNFLASRIFLAVLMVGATTSLVFQTNYDPKTKWVVIIMLIGIFPESINELCRSVYIAFEEVYFESVGVVSNVIIKLGIGLIFVYNGYGLPAIAMIILIGHLCAMIINLLIIHFRYISKWQFPNFNFLKEQLPKALPFIVIGTFYIMDNRLDKILLSFLDDEEAIGLYAAATTVIFAIGLVPDAYRVAILPIMSRYQRHDTDKLQSLYSYSYKFLAFLGIAFFIITLLTSDDILFLLYSRELPIAVTSLQILSFSIVFTFANALNTRVLLVYDKQHLTARFMLITAVINIFIVLLLIPSLGAIGAAIGTTTSAILRFLLLNRKVSQLLPSTIQSYFDWRLWATTISAAIVIWQASSLGFFLQIGLGLAIYFIMLLITEAISVEERRLIVKFSKQIFPKFYP